MYWYLVVGVGAPWDFTKGENLPEEHAHAPDIGFTAEFSEKDSLWWQPSQRNQSISPHLEKYDIFAEETSKVFIKDLSRARYAVLSHKKMKTRRI